MRLRHRSISVRILLCQCACLGACMQIWTEYGDGSIGLPSDLSDCVHNTAINRKSVYMCVEYVFMSVCEKCFLFFNASNGNLFSLPQDPHSNPFKAVSFGMCHKYAWCIYKHEL